MRARLLLAVLFVLSTAACGGTATRRIDESDDEVRGTSGGARTGAGVVAVPGGLGGTEWRFAEAHCTEHALDLASQGFSALLHVEEEDGELLLVNDQLFDGTGCATTIISRVSAPDTPGDLQMEEISRVAVPSTAECFGQPEAPRTGEIHQAGTQLEVVIHRSRWCGGFDVHFRFDAAPRGRMLTNEEIVRRYATYYSLGDADRMAALFATNAALVEPFTRTPTGDGYRHEGREEIRRWYEEAFGGSAWRALRVMSEAEGETEHEVAVEWEYMDSRLEAPLLGTNHFTIAAGEIFETTIELRSTPDVSSEFAGP